MQVEQFKNVLRKIAQELEDLSIEKELYQNMLLASGVTLDALEEAAKQALADPETRKVTHNQLLGMWETLEKTGTDAWIEDLLKGPSPSGKPN